MSSSIRSISGASFSRVPCKENESFKSFFSQFFPLYSQPFLFYFFFLCSFPPWEIFYSRVDWSSQKSWPPNIFLGAAGARMKGKQGRRWSPLAMYLVIFLCMKLARKIWLKRNKGAASDVNVFFWRFQCFHANLTGDTVFSLVPSVYCLG